MKKIGMLRNNKGSLTLYTFNEKIDGIVTDIYIPLNTFLVFDLNDCNSKIVNWTSLQKKDIVNSINELLEKQNALYPLFNFENNHQIFKAVKKLAINLAINMLAHSGMIMRLNNDSDGICGGLAFNDLPCTHILQNSPIYSNSNATEDILKLREYKNKCVVLIDFGCNEESFDAIAMLKENNIDINIIDHHPIHDYIKDYATILNSWEITKCSNVTSGYLCCEVARCLNLIDTEQAKKLSFISFAGDKSNLQEKLMNNRQIEVAQKIAYAIDYMATEEGLNKNINDFARLIDDEQKINILYNMFIEKQEMIKKLITQHAKKININNFNLILLDLKKFSDFKNMSKVCNTALEMIQQKQLYVIIGYSKKRIIIRATQRAIENGFRADQIIETLKEKDIIEVGGGHSAAASISYKHGYKNLIIEEISNLLKNL